MAAEGLLDKAMGTPTLDVGFGEDTTEAILWRLQLFNWSKQRPRYVLLLVGTNDIAHSTCDIYWGIRLQTTFPKARIFVTSILPRGANGGGVPAEGKIRALNLALRQSERSSGYLFIDAHDAFLCRADTPCTLYQENSIHLTRDGYVVLSDLVRALVLEDEKSQQ